MRCRQIVTAPGSFCIKLPNLVVDNWIGLALKFVVPRENLWSNQSFKSLPVICVKSTNNRWVKNRMLHTFCHVCLRDDKTLPEDVRARWRAETWATRLKLPANWRGQVA
jgi:hypothetical protein